ACGTFSAAIRNSTGSTPSILARLAEAKDHQALPRGFRHVSAPVIRLPRCVPDPTDLATPAPAAKSCSGAPDFSAFVVSCLSDAAGERLGRAAAHGSAQRAKR